MIDGAVVTIPEGIVNGPDMGLPKKSLRTVEACGRQDEDGL